MAAIHLNSSNCFSLVQCNIRSLRKNFDCIDTLACLYDNKLDVITVTESWLKQHDCKLYELKEYKSFDYCRKGRGGGVKVYVRDCYSVIDMCVKSIVYENVCVKISGHLLQRPIVVVSIYRPPSGDIMEFIHEIRINLNILKGENKDCIFYFVGDININLFNVWDNNVIMYCELLAECGLVNLLMG
jgi:hypothetical protein